MASQTAADPVGGYGVILLGVFLLAGFAAHVLGRRVHVPRVTLLLILGFLASPAVLNLIPSQASDWFPLAARLALSLIGFQLGEQFLGKNLKRTGKQIFTLSVFEALGAAFCVFLFMVAVGNSVEFSLLLASLGAATDPAATLDVIRESQAEGPVSSTTKGVVAIDDAWGVILFSILAAVAQILQGGDGMSGLLLGGIWELIGGVLLGCALGLPMAWLSGRIREGELTLVEALGFVFLCSGIATLLELSMIISCMAMGAMVSNFAKHHERPFHAIDEVEQPFLIVFFLLAGFNFEAGQLKTVGLIGLTYIGARVFGKVVGSYAGATLAQAPVVVRRHVGWCLIPQAGVTLGLALILSERHPEMGDRLLSVIVGTTIVFEIAGPIATRLALRHAKELNGKSSYAEGVEPRPG